MFKCGLHKVREHSSGRTDTLYDYITQGIDPYEDHFGWLAQEMGVQISVNEGSNFDDLDQFPAIIFLVEDGETPETAFSHYSVAVARYDNCIRLFDSYGFESLKLIE